MSGKRYLSERHRRSTSGHKIFLNPTIQTHPVSIFFLRGAFFHSFAVFQHSGEQPGESFRPSHHCQVRLGLLRSHSRGDGDGRAEENLPRYFFQQLVFSIFVWKRADKISAELSETFKIGRSQKTQSKSVFRHWFGQCKLNGLFLSVNSS